VRLRPSSVRAATAAHRGAQQQHSASDGDEQKMVAPALRPPQSAPPPLLHITDSRKDGNDSLMWPRPRCNFAMIKKVTLSQVEKHQQAVGNLISHFNYRRALRVRYFKAFR
jgi:hypothetical protein